MPKSISTKSWSLKNARYFQVCPSCLADDTRGRLRPIVIQKAKSPLWPSCFGKLRTLTGFRR